MEPRPVLLPRQPGLSTPTASVSNPANFGVRPALRSLLRRCVECEDVNPTCPKCSGDQTCIQVARGCDTCAQNVCVAKDSAGITQTALNDKDSGGPNVGAIAGGVIGGIVFIALMTYLVWRFFLKGRRREVDSMYAEDYDPYGEKSPQTDFTPSAEARHSTQSVRSMASTVMTRASNVIQIAFIPGITDRGHGGADDDVPPVPAIPLRQSSPSSTHPPTPYEDHHPGTPYSDAASTLRANQTASGNGQEHYFLPSDLRHQPHDRYSSAFSDDTSAPGGPGTRAQSMASSLARASVASTMYGGADQHVSVHAMPAVTALRGRANVVSVRPLNGTMPSASGEGAAPPTIPEVPPIDYFRYEDGTTNEDEQRSKAVQGDAKSASGSAREKGSGSGAASTKAPSSGKSSSKMLAQAIHEATRRASRQPTHGGLGSLSPREGKDKESPFSDINAVSDSRDS